MWDHNEFGIAPEDGSGCSSSSTSMEVLDEQHLEGVLKVLHAAKTGRLRTNLGVIEVAPSPCAPRDDRYLFELEPLHQPPAPLEDLVFEELELDFGDAVFSLEGSAIQGGPGRLKVSRPRRLFSKGLASIVVSPGIVRLRWSAGKIVLRAEVLEISMDEILLEGPGPSVVPGKPRPATIEFHEHGREHVTEIHCAVDVRPGGERRPSCARLVLLSEDDRGDLVRLYRLLRFPQLIDRGAIDRDAVVDLFERSHYLSLRETEHAAPSEAWCCPDFASDLSIDTIYRADDGALLGHVSVTRAYSKTWLGHQLATLKGHPESAASRHALYRHFACAPLLTDGEECFLLGYYNRRLRWHQLFFESFVDWVGDEDQSIVLEFDRFEPVAGAVDDDLSDVPEDVVVECLHRHDLRTAVQIITAALPALATRAFDIDEHHLQSDALHPDYEARRVDRGRQVFVLRESGETVGVALCETGSRHLSLFNLLNMGQIYLTPRRTSRKGRAVLLRAVRNFYRSRGTTDPVLVSPPGSFEHPGDVGLACEETMGCIIWSGRSLLQYQSFISYCFAKIGTSSLTSGSAATSSEYNHGAPHEHAPRTALPSSCEHRASANNG